MDIVLPYVLISFGCFSIYTINAKGVTKIDETASQPVTNQKKRRGSDVE